MQPEKPTKCKKKQEKKNLNFPTFYANNRMQILNPNTQKSIIDFSQQNPANHHSKTEIDTFLQD